MSERVEFPKWNIVFEEGVQRTNRLGNYKVLSIHGNIMDVVYLDGHRKNTVQTLEIAGQAKVIHNEKVRELQALKMSDLNLQGGDEAFTLGYLTNHSMIFVRVKECRQPWFTETYHKLTGVQTPTPNVEGHYYTVSPDDVTGSWDYWHVMFPAPIDAIKAHMVFSGDPERQVYWDQWGEYSKYNDRNYVLNLFRLGFRLGKEHDPDLVRSKVEDKDGFDNGFFCEPEKSMIAA